MRTCTIIQFALTCFPPSSADLCVCKVELHRASFVLIVSGGFPPSVPSSFFGGTL